MFRLSLRPNKSNKYTLPVVENKHCFMIESHPGIVTFSRLNKKSLQWLSQHISIAGFSTITTCNLQLENRFIEENK